MQVSSALAMGGEIPPTVASTEEWTAPAVFNQIHEGQLYFNSTTNTFKETIQDAPAGTWASIASGNTASEWQVVLVVQFRNSLAGYPPGTTRASRELGMDHHGLKWRSKYSKNQGSLGGTGGTKLQPFFMEADLVNLLE